MKSPRKVRETCILTDAPRGCDEGSRDSIGTSGADGFESGCQSEIKNSPDVTMTTNDVKNVQLKKCIIYFDRTVSLVISAAVMLTIIIFIIFFLAT
jgi:hypothetical protein